MEIAAKHMFAPPPPLDRLVSTYSNGIEQVVLKALAKDPQERFISVQAFATAFEEAYQETHLYTIEADTLPGTVKAFPSETPLSPTPFPATELASPGDVQQLPISYASNKEFTLSTPSTTNAGPITTPQRGLSRSKAALLVILVFLVLVGSASFVYLNMSKNNGVIHQVTTTITAGSDTTRIRTSATAVPKPVTTATIATNLYNSATAATGIMFGFDAQHSHYNPYEKVLTPSNINKLVNAWTYHIERDSFYIIPSSPVITNGIVYIGPQDHSFYALDANTGKKLWSRLTGNYILGSPAVANGVVYIGSEDHNLYAFDTQTGRTRWSYTTGNDVDSSPAIANGIVYVGSRDSSLYALDSGSGKVLWNYSSGNSIFSPPTVADGVVYFGSDDHSFYALNAQSGNKLWSYSTGGNIVSSPAIAIGMVYIGSDDNMLYAFQLPA